jgi:hypothetical protein
MSINGNHSACKVIRGFGVAAESEHHTLDPSSTVLPEQSRLMNKLVYNWTRYFTV